MFFRRTPSFSFLRPFRPDVPGKELFLEEQDLKGAVLSRSWKIGLPAWTVLGKDLFLVEQGDRGKEKKPCLS